MFGLFTKKSLSFNIAEVVVQRVDLKPGEHLYVTIKSDDLDHSTIQKLRDQFKVAFPNNKIALFGVGREDDVKFDIVNPQGETNEHTNG